jgi:hypothetical protein
MVDDTRTQPIASHARRYSLPEQLAAILEKACRSLAAAETNIKEFSKLITGLFRSRQTGDYDFTIKISEDEARQNVTHARIIIDAVKEYLKANSVS